MFSTTVYHPAACIYLSDTQAVALLGPTCHCLLLLKKAMFLVIHMNEYKHMHV